jgi:hypothetical protein
MSTSSNPLLRGLLSRIFSISRRTWIFLSVTFLAVILLLIWAAISTAGWLFGMARDSVNAAPEAVRAATAQVEQVIPGVHEKLGVLVPGLKPETPPREVSGTDPAPVARFPGLARVQWQRDDQQVQVRYQGKADFSSVLKHYTQEFAALGYQHTLLSATSTEERHEFIKDGEYFNLVFSTGESDLVAIDLSSRHPEKADQQAQIEATPRR